MTISIALEKDIIKSKSIIVDASLHSFQIESLFSIGGTQVTFQAVKESDISEIDEDYRNKLPQKNQSNDLDQNIYLLYSRRVGNFLLTVSYASILKNSNNPWAKGNMSFILSQS